MLLARVAKVANGKMERLCLLDLAFFKISDHFHLAKMISHLGYFAFHLGYCHVTWLLVSFQLQVSGEHCYFQCICISEK